MNTDLAAADTLERAAAYMERYGHHRGSGSPDSSLTHGLPMCAIFSITYCSDHVTHQAAALRVVDAFLGDKKIPDWSDTQPTPVVLAGLRACAALLRARVARAGCVHPTNCQEREAAINPQHEREFA